MTDQEQPVQQVGTPVPGWTPRRRPTPGPFPGRWSSVVPLELAHADVLFETCAGQGNEDLWTYRHDGPHLDRTSFADHVAGTLGTPGWVSVAVCDESGTPAGIASYMRVDPANGSVEVGGILLGRTLQRTRAATEAMHLMARHVFDDLGYRRYEWKCDDLNLPSRSAALRLGFTYEGTFRNALVYKGRNRDTAWFSITDQEWPQVAAAHRAWLVPTNFDESGCQRVSLRDLLPGTPA